MPLWFQALVLGVVQGLTEFIPVSSSGHLVIVPYLAGWEHPGLAFDVALHIGTAAAVIVYFRAELAAMLRGLLPGGRDADARTYRRLAVFVVVASAPVAVAGLLAEDAVGEVFERPLAAAGFLVVTAAVLAVGERARSRRIRRTAATAASHATDRGRVWTGDWRGGSAAVDQRTGTLPVGHDAADPGGTTLETLRLGQALTAGVFQAFALLPGVSRSGATISAGMLAGMTREAATRFSFLLSLPALIGAFILSVPDLAQPGDFSGPMIAGGVAASFVSGYAAIRFLVRLVARDHLTGFARYCLFLAAVTLIAYQFLGPPSSV